MLAVICVASAHPNSQRQPQLEGVQPCQWLWRPQSIAPGRSVYSAVTAHAHLETVGSCCCLCRAWFQVSAHQQASVGGMWHSVL